MSTVYEPLAQEAQTPAEYEAMAKAQRQSQQNRLNGANSAAGHRRKYRRELMREVMAAHSEGTVKTLDELVLAFAKEILDDVG